MYTTDLVSREAVYVVFLPLLVWVIEGLKAESGFNLPHRWAFPVALLLGIGTAFLAYAALPYPEQNWAQTVFQGIGLGAAASGVYSGGRSVLGLSKPAGPGGPPAPPAAPSTEE